MGAETRLVRRTMMILRAGLAALFVVMVAACASVPPSNPSPPAVALTQAPNRGPHMAEAAVAAEFARLRQLLAEQIPDQAEYDADGDHAWMEAAVMVASGFEVDRPQLIVVVDRNPEVQRLRIMLAEPGTAWRTVGGGKVSTGQAGRPGYFITPTGVFRHTDAIIDYRALGTRNEQGIRGLGAEGMRVWDFGWQAAMPGWNSDLEPREIRLLIHATDPRFLEPRLGRPASKGCIRIAAAMNRFLDLQGVLDADHERAAATDARIAHVLNADRTPTPLAGNTLIIIDTSRN